MKESEKLFDLLAGQPDIGQRIKTRRLGEIRRHTMGSYSIYYRPIIDGVQILLVAHGARDQNRLTRWQNV